MRDSIDYIYESLSKKYDIPKEAIVELEKHWWKSVRREIASGSGRDILTPSFGSHYVDVYNLNSYLFIYKRKQQIAEDKWRSGKIDWMSYLYRWRNAQRIIQGLEKLKNNMQKRDVRKKWERGI